MAQLLSQEDIDPSWFSDPTHLGKRARRRGLSKFVSLSGRETKFWITINGEHIMSLGLPEDVTNPKKTQSQSDEFPLHLYNFRTL